MKQIISTFIVCLTLVFSYADAQNVSEFKPVTDSIQKYLNARTTVSGLLSIDSVKVKENGKLHIYLERNITDYPLRDGDISAIYSIVDRTMPQQYGSFRGKVELFEEGRPLEWLRSNIFSDNQDKTPVREHKKNAGKFHSRMVAPMVKNESKPITITKGLNSRHIALWQSHGYYYEPSLKRWEWQRVRLFETVEDLFTQSFVLPFLVPMLENAGAVVILPRERDWNTNEVIVDNDIEGSGYSETGNWTDAPEAGFADPKDFYVYKENPFRMGSARISSSSKKAATATVQWIPDIPKKGEYAVYVSFQTVSGSTSDAHYTVRHEGGETGFSVNQQMGGGTWIYLGKFKFAQGSNPDQGVFLSNKTSDNKSIVSADAVKFGGGMGNIASKPATVDPDGNDINVDFDVEPEISGYPRFTEGSRYWLQWAGVNDTIYSWTRGISDYTDDFCSRPYWVNTLSDGSYLKPDKKGYNIPLDLSLAFHTDAGTTLNDSIIGTLAIYTLLSKESDRYPNKENRNIARDYNDMVQTQIVDDIRKLYEPEWTRRKLWNRSYAESRIPEVPAMLLELLSHQNLADMRYGLDPSFRFTVSRSIYKGMLKFLAYLNDFEYTVQPLPVNNFATSLSGKRVTLSWNPTADTLEPTAVAKSYILYSRIDSLAFDNGVKINGTQTSVNIEPGHIYSFKVTAVNEGGESFPSETLSVGIVSEKASTVLVVNNFDRVSAPVSFASSDSLYAGFLDNTDAGVAYLQDISYIGAQHEFRRNIPWRDDDSGGFGASDSNFETKVIAGNSFDYPYVHGKALMAKGLNFVSANHKAVENGQVKLSDYKTVDIICGKQVTTQVGRPGANEPKYKIFSPSLQSALKEYACNKGNILISGSNIGTDDWEPIFQGINPNKETQDFIENILKYKWMTNNASTRCIVKGVQNPFGIDRNCRYSFHHKPNSECYAVESPDGIVPACRDAFTIFRYDDNNISAGVAYKGDYKVIALGFPIEALKSGEEIKSLISQLFDFFE